MFDFRNTTNSIDPLSKDRIGKFLKASDWYKMEMEKIKSDADQLSSFESAIHHLDYFSNIYANQKVQCYGLAILVSGLDKRFPDIGGATISGVPVKNASELVPESIKSGKETKVYMGGYYAIRVYKLENVNVGDLYVRYDTTNGHVAAVIGKKIIDGKVVLLITSANQTNDGIVAVFEVDENNFDVTFGLDPFKKVVLRLP